MKYFLASLTLILFFEPMHANTKELGEQIGYMIGDYFNDSGIQYEDIIKGIRNYQQGIEPKLTEKEFKMLFHQVALKRSKAEAEESLMLSEELLNRVKDEEGILEIVPHKLYIKEIQSGLTSNVLKDEGKFHITCRTVHDKVLLDTRTNDTPVLQHLHQAILGFTQGVKGMHEGERRLLYIHPSLAYDDSPLFEPNTALIIDVKLISIP